MWTFKIGKFCLKVFSKTATDRAHLKTSSVRARIEVSDRLIIFFKVLCIITTQLIFKEIFHIFQLKNCQKLSIKLDWTYSNSCLGCCCQGGDVTSWTGCATLESCVINKQGRRSCEFTAPKLMTSPVWSRDCCYHHSLLLSKWRHKQLVVEMRKSG